MRPGKAAFVGSAGLHFALFILAWWTETATPQPVEFVSFEIQLYSPPSSVEGQPAVEEELTVETPEDAPPEPAAETEPEPDPVPPEPAEDAVPEEEEPDPEEPEEPEPSPPEDDAPPPEPTVEDVEAGTPNPDPEAETRGEDISVRMEGLRRDYPAYYDNIIRQIQRCFRWTGGQDLDSTVRFYIERQGTVSGLSVVEPSGNFAFDIEAMGAVECAGSGGRLGPLPEQLPYERLPIEFTFSPAGG